MPEEKLTPLQEAFLAAVRGEAPDSPAQRPHDCGFTAIVGGYAYPCHAHKDGQHHFAARWPACPAPFCRLKPDHREPHDIPAGHVVLTDRAAAEGDPGEEVIHDRAGRGWHRWSADVKPCRCHRSFASITPFHEGHCCFFPPGQTCHPEEVAEWERQRDLRHAGAQDKEATDG